MSCPSCLPPQGGRSIARSAVGWGLSLIIRRPHGRLCIPSRRRMTVRGLLPRSAYGDSSSRTAASRGTMNRRVIQSKIPDTFLRKFSLALHRSNGQNDTSAPSGQGKKPLSALEIAVDLLADIGCRRIACELLAVDEKSGRSRHTELLG